MEQETNIEIEQLIASSEALRSPIPIEYQAEHYNRLHGLGLNTEDISRLLKSSKETFSHIIQGLLGLPFLSFSYQMRWRIREEQDFKCAECGVDLSNSPHLLQCHHRIPVSRGGADTRENGVALCPPDHAHYDELALEDGIIYPDIPISEAPRTLFKHGKT